MAEMILGYPLFRGRDNNDQLTQIMRIVGTPEEKMLRKINIDSVSHPPASLDLSRGPIPLLTSVLLSARDCSSTVPAVPETAVPDADTSSASPGYVPSHPAVLPPRSV